MYRILLIDDDATVRRSADDALSALGHTVVAVDAAEAMAAMERESFDVVMAGVLPSPPVTHDRTAPSIPDTLVYLPKPFTTGDVLDAVHSITEREGVREALERARHDLAAAGPATLVGSSQAITRTLQRVRAVADSDAAVLLTGESGTGKDLIARQIHAHGARSGKAFVAVNCAAFPESLLEAELFGHERGAFTGALQRRQGRFKAADGGTLFLDEINGLSLAAQAKLLRVLQDGTFQPVGTNTTLAVNVRLISATNRELKTLVANREFREDLYYRVKVLEVSIPPLRERVGDVPLLVQHFLEKHGPKGAAAPSVSPRAWAVLTQHAFPGNVRELEHSIQQALVLSRGGEIDVEHLPHDLGLPDADGLGAHGGEVRPLLTAVREFERAYLLKAIELSRGNKTLAARMLGISRKSLWEKLARSAPGSEPSRKEARPRYRH